MEVYKCYAFRCNTIPKTLLDEPRKVSSKLEEKMLKGGSNLNVAWGVFPKKKKKPQYNVGSSYCIEEPTLGADLLNKPHYTSIVVRLLHYTNQSHFNSRTYRKQARSINFEKP